MLIHAAISTACATMVAWEVRSPDVGLTSLDLGRSIALGPGAIAPTYTLFNIPSNELYGSWQNHTDAFPVSLHASGIGGMSLDVIGFRWRAELTTFGTSWLSDFALRLYTPFSSNEYLLFPALGSDAPGSGVFESEGWIWLPEPIDMPNGYLFLEFFESYNDAFFATDGVWNSLEIQFMTNLVPSPGSAGMAAVGLVFALRRRR